MALIKCPECNKEISDMASACPCCGYPISNTKKPIIGKMTLACPNCGYYVGEIVKNILKKIEKIQKAKEEYQKVYRMNQKLYIIMKAVDIPCTEFPSDSSDSLEWFSNNFNEIKKITLNHIELISDNVKEDYENFQTDIEKENYYTYANIDSEEYEKRIERIESGKAFEESQSHTDKVIDETDKVIEIITGNKQCPNCSYPIREIVEKIQKAKEEYEKLYMIQEKTHLIMKAYDIPCTEFPCNYSCYDKPFKEWLHKYSDKLREWFSNNFNEIKKITLNHIELISANAKEDYEELQERIKKEEESIEEERKEREEEEKMKEFYAQCDKTNAEAEALAQRLRAAARGERIAPTQKCPNCGSSNVSSISTAKRLASTTLWGLASSTLGKTKECKSCGYKW